MAKIAILLLSDGQRAQTAVAGLTEAGYEALVAQDLRALADGVEAKGCDLLLVDGPFAQAPGTSMLQTLRQAGLIVPTLIACSSRLEAECLTQLDGLRPFAAIRALNGGVLRKALTDLAVDQPAAPARPALVGTLDETGLAHLLLYILSESWTGRLALDAGGTSKAIHFDSGAPVWCSSTIFSENFGQMLLRRGVITEIEYEWARKLQLREGVRQGEALVKIGVLTHQDLFQQLRHQIREKIINAFGWTRASYRLEAGEEHLENVTRFVLNSIELVIAGRRRAYERGLGRPEWEAIRHRWGVTHCDSPLVAQSASQALPDAVISALKHPQPIADLALGLQWTRAEAYAVFSTLVEAHYICLADRREALPQSKGADLVAAEVLGGLAAQDAVAIRAAEGGEKERDAEGLSESLWKAYLRFSSTDFFSLLGVSPESTGDEVAAARDELIDVYSTDRFRPILHEARNLRALEELQQIIHKAAATLLHENRRAIYLASLDDDRQAERRQILNAEDEFQAGLGHLEVDVETARAHFSRALALHPDEPLYVLYSGWSQYLGTHDEAKRAEAKRLMIRSIAADPGLDQGYLLLAKVYAQEGDIDEAAEQARMALAFNPDNDEASELLAELTG